MHRSSTNFVHYAFKYHIMIILPYIFPSVFSDAPPTPGRLVILNVTSTTVTISWPEVACDGGHDLQSFTVRIGYGLVYFLIELADDYINSINNYTITGLTPNINYQISVRAEGLDGTYSNYSRSVTITTLPPG